MADSAPTRVASFRLKNEAHDRITERAATAGVSPRVWLEKAILDNRTEIVARAKPSPDYKALVFQINKAGNNLNQIAHHLNTLALMDAIDARKYLSVLDELSSIEAALTDALTHARPS